MRPYTHRLLQNFLLRFAIGCNAAGRIYPSSSLQENSSNFKLDSALYTGENRQTHLAEPMSSTSMRSHVGQGLTTHFTSQSLSVPVLCPCSWWWEQLKPAKGRVSSRAQEALKQSKCNQKRMRVLLGKDCSSSSKGS